MTTPIVKVTDLAWGRLRAPDLDVMEEFLTHFGMVRSARTDSALYMRGSDSPHHIHVTEKGDPKFVGFAYYARSEDDLALAGLPGARVEAIDEPAAASAWLSEPNGSRSRWCWTPSCRRSRAARPAQHRRRTTAAQGRLMLRRNRRRRSSASRTA